METPGGNPGEFQVGDVVGDTYIVVAYMGRGAMGHVYHVKHKMLNVEYALKTIRKEKFNEHAWKRFQNEAQAIAILTHPNIVGVYNLGLHEGRVPYYVMDLLHGIDLNLQIKRSGPLEIKRAARVFIEICAGLSFAHKKGIIHRDIKPGNIFLLHNPGPVGERVKIVDFGIAKLVEVRDSTNQDLTKVGDVVGTPYYMSPEQCMAERVDARSDIYSLGCTLFEALTGTMPFRGRNATEIMLQHQSAPVPSLRSMAGDKNFPEKLELIMAKVLAKEPAERYQTMEQLANELATLLEGEQVTIAGWYGLADRAGGTDTSALSAVTGARTVVPGGATGKAAGTASGSAAGAASVGPPAYAGAPASAGPPTVRGQTIELAMGKKIALISSVVAVVVLAAGGLFAWTLVHSDGTSKQLSAGEKALQAPPVVATVDEDEKDDATTRYERQTAAIERAKTAQIINSHQRYCTVRGDGGKIYRFFDFPKEIVIGKISVEGKVPVEAVGTIKFPLDKGITFTPSAAVESNPECLTPFSANDIYAVELAPDACSQQILSAVAGIPAVAKLDFSKTNKLTEPAVETMSKFRNLDVYVGASAPTDASVLAKADCWSKLHQLYLPFSKNCSSLLEKLREYGEMRRLGLGPSDLSWQDYKTLAGMDKLVYLDLNGNGVTDKQLQLLVSLHNLDTLNLINSRVTVASLDSLKKFSRLEKLLISSPGLSPGDFQSIKRALPKVKVFQNWH